MTYRLSQSCGLFGEMLKDINYPDTHLISDICHGFASRVGFELPKQPSMTLKRLLGMAKGLNEAVLAKAAGAQDTELVNAAWTETMDELEKQWIWKDDSKTFAGLSLTHRFGLQQQKKVRVIDNFKTRGVNATCGVQEKQKLFGLDFLATTLVRALTQQGVALPCGLQGKTFIFQLLISNFPFIVKTEKLFQLQYLFLEKRNARCLV